MTVRSGSSKQSNSRPIVDLAVAINGRTHTVEANIQDRSHMNYQLLLGRDILESYHVDVAKAGDTHKSVSADDSTGEE